MTTRNPANEIKFNETVKDVTDALGYGAKVTVYAIAGATGADTETNPGEDMEKFVEVIQQRGTTVGLGAFAGGAFDVYVEGSSWADAAAVEAAVQAVGGVFASATVA